MTANNGFITSRQFRDGSEKTEKIDAYVHQSNNHMTGEMDVLRPV
jgi:hypothetical protein